MAFGRRTLPKRGGRQFNARGIHRNTPSPTGDGYLRADGPTGSGYVAPDSVALSFPGDIDLRVMVGFESTSFTGAVHSLLAKLLSTGNQRSWELRINAAGVLTFISSPDGIATTTTSGPNISTLPAAYLNGKAFWLRMTMDVDDGAANRVHTWYTSDDGVAWTTLSGPTTVAGVISFFDSTAKISVGGLGDTAATQPSFKVRIYAAEVYNGIGGTKVASPTFRARKDLSHRGFTDANGNAWTPGATGDLIYPRKADKIFKRRR